MWTILFRFFALDTQREEERRGEDCNKKVSNVPVHRLCQGSEESGMPCLLMASTRR